MQIEASDMQRGVDAARVEEVPSPQDCALRTERVQSDRSGLKSNHRQCDTRSEADPSEFVDRAIAVLAPRSRQRLHRMSTRQCVGRQISSRGGSAQNVEIIEQYPRRFPSRRKVERVNARSQLGRS